MQSVVRMGLGWPVAHASWNQCKGVTPVNCTLQAQHIIIVTQVFLL